MSKKDFNNVFGNFKEASNEIITLYGKQIGRSLHITGITTTASSLIALGKLLMGILSLSLFTCVNALYSFGMIGAKIIALIGIRKAKNYKEQCRYYIIVGVMLIVSSIFYIIYSLYLYLNPILSSYDSYIAIGIAAVTFTEIGMNIRGVIKTKHNHNILIHSIRIINLASSLIALTLTQTALLSYSNKYEQSLDISRASGKIGVLMGIVSVILGIFTLRKAICLIKEDSKKNEELKVL